MTSMLPADYITWRCKHVI